ncbi:MAG: hypothetical protein K8S15_03975 [Candidatus Aegiribacteria sp.]|nr:hypothetical protein [Candidatus Aegiribacteria sp.]
MNLPTDFTGFEGHWVGSPGVTGNLFNVVEGVPSCFLNHSTWAGMKNIF